MKELMEQMQKRRQFGQNAQGKPPQKTRLELLMDFGEVLDIDEEMIELLFTYKQKVQAHRDDMWEDKVQEMKSKSGPSEEAKELVSFVYDHMDKFEEVLSEEKSNELESLMMNV